jgi:hypothetical protein
VTRFLSGVCPARHLRAEMQIRFPET